MASPHDGVSLKRILNVPSRGIGKKALEILEEVCRKHQWNFDEGLRRAGSLGELPGKAQRAISDFYGLLVSLRRVKEQFRLVELSEKILEATGYVEALEEEKTIEAQARIENIEEFFSVLEDFDEQADSESTGPRLEAFLESISLMTDLDTWDAGTNILTLMTLHTAKGLEFPIVYIVGLEEGIFPNVNGYTEDPEDLEEECRLCYVGITRAKDKLYLSYANQRRLYGSLQHNLPSRFLNEIPSELFETRRQDFGFDSQRNRRALDDMTIDVDPDELKRRILFD